MKTKLCRKTLKEALMCGEVWLFDEIDSTNEYLLKHARELPSGSLCVAESQTAGRGRRGRTWYSPDSQNLYFSMLWRYDLADLAQVSSLSLAVAITVAEVFEGLGVANIQIKWPNDIYYQGKKMGGILLENRVSGCDLYLVIGIGLNLGMPPVAESVISQPWITLNEFAFDRNRIAAQLAHLLQTRLIAFPHTEFASYLPRWQKFDRYYQKNVKLLTEQGDICGVSQGINERGELVLKQADGQVLTFAMGEISLRPE